MPETLKSLFLLEHNAVELNQQKSDDDDEQIVQAKQTFNIPHS